VDGAGNIDTSHHSEELRRSLKTVPEEHQACRELDVRETTQLTRAVDAEEALSDVVGRVSPQKRVESRTIAA